ETKLADGIAISTPHPEALRILSKEVERVVEVDDRSIEHAMKLLFKTTHNVAEGAGAAALAAVLQEKEGLRGKKIAAVLSGGNVDTEIYRKILSTASPQ